MLGRAVLVAALIWGLPAAAQTGAEYDAEAAEEEERVPEPPPKPKPAPVLTLSAKKALASFCALAANRNDARCKALRVPSAAP